ncbi:MAG: signal peptidase II, partial [Clostridia bacterium]|nr:signal peptidase II [Clostridia bacterium]
MLWTLLMIAAAVALDQWTKYLAVTHLQPIDTLPILDNILHLTYLENRGAAFGMLANHRWIFMILST